MNLSQMYYFQVVAKEEHISHAAQKLHISQPSLSATIHRLETELNTTLFERRGRNIYLNTAGRRLLDHVQYIFSQLEQLEKDLKDTAFNADHCLSIGINNSSFFDVWLTNFILNNPTARITQSTMTEEEMFSALQNETIDIAIGHFTTPPQDITRHTLLRDEYIIVMSKNHPLSNKEILTFDDICNEEFVSLPSNTSNNIIHQIFSQRNISPHIIFEGQQNMLLKILHKKQCLLFASRQMLYLQEKKFDLLKKIKSFSDYPELTQHSIAELQTCHDFSICWKKNRTLPAMAKNFIDNCIENYDTYYDPLTSPPCSQHTQTIEQETLS